MTPDKGKETVTRPTLLSLPEGVLEEARDVKGEGSPYGAEYKCTDADFTEEQRELFQALWVENPTRLRKHVLVRGKNSLRQEALYQVMVKVLKENEIDLVLKDTDGNVLIDAEGKQSWNKNINLHPIVNWAEENLEQLANQYEIFLPEARETVSAEAIKPEKTTPQVEELRRELKEAEEKAERAKKERDKRPTLKEWIDLSNKAEDKRSEVRDLRLRVEYLEDQLDNAVPNTEHKAKVKRFRENEEVIRRQRDRERKRRRAAEAAVMFLRNQLKRGSSSVQAKGLIEHWIRCKEEDKLFTPIVVLGSTDESLRLRLLDYDCGYVVDVFKAVELDENDEKKRELAIKFLRKKTEGEGENRIRTEIETLKRLNELGLHNPGEPLTFRVPEMVFTVNEGDDSYICEEWIEGNKLHSLYELNLKLDERVQIARNLIDFVIRLSENSLDSADAIKAIKFDPKSKTFVLFDWNVVSRDSMDVLKQTVKNVLLILTNGVSVQSLDLDWYKENIQENFDEISPEVHALNRDLLVEFESAWDFLRSETSMEESEKRKRKALEYWKRILEGFEE